MSFILFYISFSDYDQPDIYVVRIGTGRWSDGSKEWTPKWLSALDALGHTFGDDGAFIMEYEDFLETWTLVHRTRLFDPSWIVSSLWLNAMLRGPCTVWDYGDVSCEFPRFCLCFSSIFTTQYENLDDECTVTFRMPKASTAIIVLSQMDDRYFPDLSGPSKFTLDFKLFKKGEKKVIANSSHSTFFRRSVNCEVELEAGDYVVHVRIFFL